MRNEQKTYVKRNPHYEAIVAYAEGKVIEYLNPMTKKYEVCQNPMFYLDGKYRVKDMSMHSLLNSIKKVENTGIKHKHIDSLIVEAKKADLELDLLHEFIMQIMNNDHIYDKAVKLLDRIKLETKKIIK